MDKGLTEVRRQGQIEKQLTEQNDLLTTLETTYAALGSRLEGALRQPAPAAIEDTAEQELVPIARELRSHNRRIIAITNDLQDILERLEL